MNSSRHANRSSRGQAPRGRGGFQHSNRSEYTSVPSIQQVTVGASVSIVLKVDQPTGRQVQGTVAELLTRGNHPRGIKVRFQDGRVGRVQRMATEEEAKAGSEGMSGLGRNGESYGRVSEGGARPVGSGRCGAVSGGRYENVRNDGFEKSEREEASLAEYVVVKTKGKGKKGSKLEAEVVEEDEGQGQESFESSLEQASTSIITICPVCGVFEGDEMAIAHHVNEHFD